MLQIALHARYFINQVKQSSKYQEEFKNYFNAIDQLIKNTPIRDQWEEPLNYSSGHVESAFAQFESSMSNLLKDLDSYINSKFDQYNEDSLELYESMRHDLVHPNFKFDQPTVFDYPDKILKRKMPLTDEQRQSVVERIVYHSTWEYPGLMIRPGLENFIEHMVPSDPLYLADHITGLLEPALKPFPQQYQRRVRLYNISDDASDIFVQLPKKQFSLVVVWYFFEFKPLHIIEKYLTQIFDLLRPGGVVAFTLNDCDYSHNVGLADHKFCCFTPGSRVLNFAKQIGYNVFYEYHTLSELHWFELKKPGELTTLRGGQSLAKIIPL